MARTRVAKARLTPGEHDELLAQAKEAGVNPSEYLRDLIVGHRSDIKDVLARLASIESRVAHVEAEVARIWAGGQA